MAYIIHFMNLDRPSRTTTRTHLLNYTPINHQPPTQLCINTNRTRVKPMPSTAHNPPNRIYSHTNPTITRTHKGPIKSRLYLCITRSYLSFRTYQNEVKSQQLNLVNKPKVTNLSHMLFAFLGEWYRFFYTHTKQTNYHTTFPTSKQKWFGFTARSFLSCIWRVGQCFISTKKNQLIT